MMGVMYERALSVDMGDGSRASFLGVFVHSNVSAALS